MHPSKVRVPYHREKLIRSPAGYPVNANQIPVAVTARRGQGLRGKRSLGGAGSAAWARAPAKERTTTVSATLPHCQKRKIEGGQVPGWAEPELWSCIRMMKRAWPAHGSGPGRVRRFRRTRPIDHPVIFVCCVQLGCA